MGTFQAHDSIDPQPGQTCCHDRKRLSGAICLFERPVFRRFWIIQEMALARITPHGACGGKPQQGGAAEFNTHSYANNIMRIRSEVKYNIQRPYVALVVDFEATDPTRDKVYAMLGLLQLSNTSRVAGFPAPGLPLAR
ncbi:hypothetical protein B0O99DRAFT_597027 [Bisporella sp. PMI_857]|nr:hypothetical protein B0O99DRAFT_597027 [Bisporella sp. PMI_857]